MTWVLAGMAIVVLIMGYLMYSMNEDIRELKKAVIQLLEFEIQRNPGFPIRGVSLRK
jgi:hypothetical protein